MACRGTGRCSASRAVRTARVTTERGVELIGQMHPIDARGVRRSRSSSAIVAQRPGASLLSSVNALGPRHPHPKPHVGRARQTREGEARRGAEPSSRRRSKSRESQEEQSRGAGNGCERQGENERLAKQGKCSEGELRRPDWQLPIGIGFANVLSAHRCIPARMAESDHAMAGQIAAV